MARLLVEKGPEKGRVVDLPALGRLLVGREHAAALRLTDVMTSRRHFELEHSPQGVEIRDLGSSNGTYVNGRKVTLHQLKLGDSIQVGETLISFLEQQPSGRADELVGRVIAGYRIEDRVGRGGMGTVYRATQVSLERQVAFKILSPQLAGDVVFRDQFVREARSAAKLNHPHIVQVYDVGEAEGCWFISMEYLGGGSVLDRLRQQGRLEPAEALGIVRQAAEGLAYAQRMQLVHRDIKPDNLMLSKEGVVKIGDLGIAGTMEGRKLEQTAGACGSPFYIAPEQAQGRAIDHRADLYALGVTFYELVTGQPPFTGKSPKEVMLKHITDAPPPVQERRADLSPVMAAVIHKLMAKDPAGRYEGAQALLADLDRIGGPPSLEGVVPSDTAPAGALPEPSRRFSRSFLPLVLGLTSALLLAFLVGMGILGGVLGEADQEARARYIDAALVQARAHLKRGAHEAAAAIAVQLATQFPGHARAAEFQALADDIGRFRIEGRARQREAEAQGKLREAEALAAAGQEVAAEKAFEALVRDFAETESAGPGRAALQRLDVLRQERERRRAAEATRQRERAAALEQGLADVQRRLKDGDYGGAFAELARWRDEYPEGEVRDRLDALQETGRQSAQVALDAGLLAAGREAAARRHDAALALLKELRAKLPLEWAWHRIDVGVAQIEEDRRRWVEAQAQETEAREAARLQQALEEAGRLATELRLRSARQEVQAALSDIRSSVRRAELERYGRALESAEATCAALADYINARGRASGLLHTTAQQRYVAMAARGDKVILAHADLDGVEVTRTWPQLGSAFVLKGTKLLEGEPGQRNAWAVGAALMVHFLGESAQAQAEARRLARELKDDDPLRDLVSWLREREP